MLGGGARERRLALEFHRLGSSSVEDSGIGIMKNELVNNFGTIETNSTFGSRRLVTFHRAE